MKLLIHTLFLINFLIFLSACDHSNSRRMTPPETYNKVDLKSEVAILQNSNAVDILFVVDNSASMLPHQQKLSENINRLVQVFESKKNLDYHIGITSIFDSRYGNEIKKFNPNGFLLPLNGSTKQANKYFYTREHNDINLLAASIKIGVVPLMDPTGKFFTGPEHEQIFSPIMAAFSAPALESASNKGFYRPEARLAVIIITDADDESPQPSATELDRFLKNLKNDPTGEKISTFGVLANRDECEKVDAGMVEKPYSILDFLHESRGMVLSICKGDFAKMMTTIGTAIEQKSQKQRVSLNGIPEQGTLRIYLGTKELSPGPKTWAYDPSRNEVVISAVPKSKDPKEREISIKYTEVKMQNQSNGRAKRF